MPSLSIISVISLISFWNFVWIEDVDHKSWDFPYLGSFVSLSRALAIVQSCRVVNYLSTLLFAWNKLALVRRAQFQTLCKWDFNSPHKTFPEAQRTLTQSHFSLALWPDLLFWGLFLLVHCSLLILCICVFPRLSRQCPLRRTWSPGGSGSSPSSQLPMLPRPWLLLPSRFWIFRPDKKLLGKEVDFDICAIGDHGAWW